MDTNATYIQDVTYRQVREALVAINRNLSSKKLDPELTLRLSNNKMELNKANDQFDNAVEDLEQQYLEFDEDGNPKTELKHQPDPQTGQMNKQRVKVYTDRDAFLEDVEDLLDKQIRGGVRMENIDYDAFGSIDEQTFTALRDFFLDTGRTQERGAEQREPAEPSEDSASEHDAPEHDAPEPRQ